MLRPVVLLVLLLGLHGAAFAQAPAQVDIAAKQVASLFVASCVRHVGAPDALRDWAAKIGLVTLPDPGQAGFLKGAPGKVYDASNPAGKYVLVSLDDGGCLVLAEAVNTAELLRATEAALAQAKITASLENEHIDPAPAHMRHRTYRAGANQAEAGGRGMTLVISFGPGKPDQAMLSAAAR